MTACNVQSEREELLLLLALADAGFGAAAACAVALRCSGDAGRRDSSIFNNNNIA